MHDALDARKPVVALLGEFSAGKSTLSNFLLGEGRSPVKVTATQLPPLWFSHGEERIEAVDHAGDRRGIDRTDLADVLVSETSHVRVRLPAAALERFDLIDMPGNSDPNMPASVWRDMLHHADIAIWCTHATQAWRQSEAACWDELPATLRRRSLLLLTRFDKLLTDRDRSRVLRRVAAETDGAFAAILPIALPQAIAAQVGSENWRTSGAEALSEALDRLVAGALTADAGVEGQALAPRLGAAAPRGSQGDPMVRPGGHHGGDWAQVRSGSGSERASTGSGIAASDTCRSGVDPAARRDRPLPTPVTVTGPAPAPADITGSDAPPAGAPDLPRDPAAGAIGVQPRRVAPRRVSPSAMGRRPTF